MKETITMLLFYGLLVYLVFRAVKKELMNRVLYIEVSCLYVAQQ